MNDATQRTVVRWIHIGFALPILGYIYGPPAEVQPYAPWFRFVYVPVTLLAGLWLWKGPALRRWFAK